MLRAALDGSKGGGRSGRRIDGAGLDRHAGGVDDPETRDRAEELLSALGGSARGELERACRKREDAEIRARAARIVTRLEHSGTLHAAVERELGWEWMEGAWREIAAKALVRDGWNLLWEGRGEEAARCARAALER
jgi:hypothetical protein